MKREPMTDSITTKDHDLLIVVNAKLDQLSMDVKELKDGTTVKIADHELRINKLEFTKSKQITLLNIGIGLLSLLTSILVYHILGK